MTSMTINGEAMRFNLDPATPLLWALRDAANLTGAKYGCDSGECGACMVIVDERAMPSCTLSIGSLEGAEIITIEGLAPGRGHPIQQAWAAEQVSQCGYCEPGVILSIAALLRANPRPSEAEIAALTNICRCGIGPRARKAIIRASMALTGGDSLVAIARQNAPPQPVLEEPKRFSNGSSDQEQVSSQ
ncbi:MAG: (2Fe-2S)-binding protein [Sphingomonas bacterium]|nr:(2Fe-2S)-binding protein [Sphingomonas bacterium]